MVDNPNLITYQGDKTCCLTMFKSLLKRVKYYVKI